MGLMEEIGRGPVALDTSVFIFFIEEHPKYHALVEPLFSAIDRGRLRAVTSSITLLEVLVVPYRVGNLVLAEKYETLLSRSEGLTMVDLTPALLRSAAQLRATHNLRTPDSLQLAAALAEYCRVFLTNDRQLPSVAGARVVQLRDYL